MTIDRKRNLIRILRGETADHPMMGDAILAHVEHIDAMRWDRSPDTEQAAARLANDIEDWCGYRGQPIDDFIREPYLTHWRQTCYNAMQKAQFEADSWL